jgi:hypothetical protein
VRAALSTDTIYMNHIRQAIKPPDATVKLPKMMGLKSRKYKFTLSSAIIMITAMTLLITATPVAFAQSGGIGGPGGGNAGTACPEGFTLNRGVCQAEPTLTCENYNVYQPRTHIDENGHCIVRETTLPVCVYDEETGRIIEDYSYFYMSCYVAGTEQNIQLTDSEPKCEYSFRPEHPINDSTLEYTERGEAICVFYTDIGPAAPQCDAGILNTESGMCEVKPGNRNRA